jgi:hypothetical protein
MAKPSRSVEPAYKPGNINAGTGCINRVLKGHGVTGCGKLDRAVGRGFIPGKKPAISMWALAPEVRSPLAGQHLCSQP